MSSAAHLRLRAATRDAHDRLDRDLGIVERLRSGGDRAELVAGFFRLHAEVEAAIGPWLSEVRGLDFEDRRRTPQLRADLGALGAEAPTALPDAVTAGGVGEALGLMYVLEGSTLGGQVIRREVGDMPGLGFLDPYGNRTGERWRSFLQVLELELARPGDTDAAVAGAIHGFEHAQRHLCPEIVGG